MKKQLTTLFLTLTLFAAGFYAATNTQELIDWWKLRDYQPSERIASITDATGMNDEGRDLFYVNDPQIVSSKTEFRTNCQTQSEIIVLGCHVGNNRIFIYDVNDERLKGIVEVTSAHEMLHAAYERLSTQEREDVNALLESHYESLKMTDERLRQTIESYAQRDLSVVPNELHSILGSEKRDLPERLEEYYKEYFSDRMKSVALSEAYDEAFAERQHKIDDFDQQLAQLQSEITRYEASSSDTASSLQAERTELNRLRESDPEAYNARVPGYNSLVQSYNIAVENLRSTIDSYNDIVRQRNEIALEERDLVNAIDSRIERL